MNTIPASAMRYDASVSYDKDGAYTMVNMTDGCIKVFRPTKGHPEGDNKLFTMLADCADYRCEYKMATKENTYIGRPEAQHSPEGYVATTIFRVDDYHYLVLWNLKDGGRIDYDILPEIWTCIWTCAYEKSESQPTPKRGRPKGSKNKPKSDDDVSDYKTPEIAKDMTLVYVIEGVATRAYVWEKSPALGRWVSANYKKFS